MDEASNWWDGVELWVTGLAFVPQVALVLVVILPIALLIAYILDTAVQCVLGLARKMGRRTLVGHDSELGDR